MPAVSGLGTTYNLPNYGGEILQITPTETPFLTAIGGLNEQGEVDQGVKSVEFEWQTQDMGEPAQPEILEGADAPNLEERSRANVSNVAQIFQYAFGVSYTRQAATGQMSGVNNNQDNPVTDEIGRQTNLTLTKAARDINFSFLRGTYQKPANNSTARKTRGLLQAIQTNVRYPAGTPKAFAATAADDLLTANGHGYANGQQVVLSNVNGGAPLAGNTIYWVRDVTANTFKLAATSGGAAINITTDGTGSVRAVPNPLTSVDVLDTIQMVWGTHGINGALNPTLMCNATIKRALTKLFVTDKNYREQTRNVGGVSLQVLETDFGQVNLMLDRVMPVDTLAFVHLGMCRPRYLEIPGKGFLFVEPLAKTGAQDKYQLYGECGLEYGAETAHARMEGVAGIEGA